MDKTNLVIEIVAGVPAELLKWVTENLYELLRQSFERYLNGDEIPNEWKTGHFSAIYKKGRRTNMKTTEELQYWISLADYMGK
jgi:hypothetical protein